MTQLHKWCKETVTIVKARGLRRS